MPSFRLSFLVPRERFGRANEEEEWVDWEAKKEEFELPSRVSLNHAARGRVRQILAEYPSVTVRGKTYKPRATELIEFRAIDISSLAPCASSSQVA